MLRRVGCPKHLMNVHNLGKRLYVPRSASPFLWSTDVHVPSQATHLSSRLASMTLCLSFGLPQISSLPVLEELELLAMVPTGYYLSLAASAHLP